MSTSTVYQIEENGCDVYTVKVKDLGDGLSEIKVYLPNSVAEDKEDEEDKEDDDEEDEEDYVVHQATSKKIFYGKDEDGTVTRILYEVKEDKDKEVKNCYVIIGSHIVKFRAPEKIKRFHAPLGNNAVVYPYAYTDSYFYFLDVDTMCYIKDDGYEHSQTLYERWYNEEKFCKSTTKLISVEILHTGF